MLSRPFCVVLPSPLPFLSEHGPMTSKRPDEGKAHNGRGPEELKEAKTAPRATHQEGLEGGGVPPTGKRDPYQGKEERIRHFRFTTSTRLMAGDGPE